MAKKLTIKTDKTLNEVLNKLTPSWEHCVSQETLMKAQEPKSQARSWLFGTIINRKFIKLSKGSAGFKAGQVVSISDLYEPDTASNIAGLIIYRLANSGLQCEPKVVEA